MNEDHFKIFQELLDCAEGLYSDVVYENCVDIKGALKTPPEEIRNAQNLLKKLTL